MIVIWLYEAPNIGTKLRFRHTEILVIWVMCLTHWRNMRPTSDATDIRQYMMSDETNVRQVRPISDATNIRQFKMWDAIDVRWD